MAALQQTIQEQQNQIQTLKTEIANYQRIQE